MLKKVAMYGPKYRSAVQQLARILSPEYEISIWLDDSNSRDIRCFSGKPLISYKHATPENSDEMFDLVIIPETNQSKEVIDTLIRNGIDRARISDWSIAKNFLVENNLQVFKRRHHEYEGLIFGMSSSYWGILTSELDKSFFKFSMPALDLYYMNLQLQEILNDRYLKPSMEGSGFRSNLKYLIIELPYYSFNYDMSLNKANMRNQMIIADYFKDYHNFNFNDPANMIVYEQFLLWKDLFFDQLKFNDSFCYFDHIVRNGNISEEQKLKSKLHLSNVYEGKHKGIRAENINALEKMIKKIHDYDEKIEPIIIVAPQTMYEYIYHETIIEGIKCDFEKIISETMGKYNVKYHYYDLFKEYFDKDEYFHGPINLNSTGSFVFSKRINQIFRNEIYTD